jgi:hypothetical protein
MDWHDLQYSSFISDVWGILKRGIILSTVISRTAFFLSSIFCFFAVSNPGFAKGTISEISGVSTENKIVTADLDIVGRVPVILQSALTFDRNTLIFHPNEKVRDRVIGQIHLKFNIPLSAIQISSNHANGIPSNAFGEKYPFGPYGFEVRIKDCPGLDRAATNPIPFSGVEYAPVDISAKIPLTTGIQTTCDLLASWDGAENASTKNPGPYTVDYQLTLVPAN